MCIGGRLGMELNIESSSTISTKSTDVCLSKFRQTNASAFENQFASLLFHSENWQGHIQSNPQNFAMTNIMVENLSMPSTTLIIYETKSTRPPSPRLQS